MKMGFRWYGEGNDTVSLDDIRQIPGVETVVWSLHHKQAGEVWEETEIAAEIATITRLTGQWQDDAAAFGSGHWPTPTTCICGSTGCT